MIKRITVDTRGQGLHEITSAVEDVIREGGVHEGVCTIFIQHTSASLIVQENADPAVCHDLERWLNRLIPEGDSLYTHASEGDDDMPAHIKSALTASSISIPVIEGRLGLGTWQGIYLWEHRRNRTSRQVVVHIQR
ncbi:MAG: secondary thiamine-phosphate synthase enzyme YjbQ [Acidiferrobacterales bacterium]